MAKIRKEDTNRNNKKLNNFSGKKDISNVKLSNNYFKNVSKSVSYAVGKSVRHDLLPDVFDRYDQVKDTTSYVRDNFKNFNQVDKVISNRVKTSQAYKDGQQGLKNILSDLKSGKWYNKEREEKASNMAFEAFEDDSDLFGEEFKDDFGSDEDIFGSSNDSFDNDFNDESAFDAGSYLDKNKKKSPVNGVTQVDNRKNVKIQKFYTAGGSSGELDVSLTKIQMENANRNNDVISNIMMRHTEQTLGSLDTINGNLGKIMEYTNTVINPYIEKTTQFYEDNINSLKGINESIASLFDLIKTAYTTQNETDETTLQSAYEKVFGIGGGSFDSDAYKEYLRRNLDEILSENIMVDSEMIKDMIDMMRETGMIDELIANPIGNAMRYAFPMLISSGAKEGFNVLNEIARNIPDIINTKLLKMKKEGSILGKLFGVEHTAKSGYKMETTKAELNKAKAFSNQDHIYITKVIPKYLAEIAMNTAKTAGDKTAKARYYDDISGKFVTEDEAKRNIAKENKEELDSKTYRAKYSFEKFLNEYNNYAGKDNTKLSDKDKEVLSENLQKFLQVSAINNYDIANEDNFKNEADRKRFKKDMRDAGINEKTFESLVNVIQAQQKHNISAYNELVKSQHDLMDSYQRTSRQFSENISFNAGKYFVNNEEQLKELGNDTGFIKNQNAPNLSMSASKLASAKLNEKSKVADEYAVDRYNQEIERLTFEINKLKKEGKDEKDKEVRKLIKSRDKAERKLRDIKNGKSDENSFFAWQTNAVDAGVNFVQGVLGLDSKILDEDVRERSINAVNETSSSRDVYKAAQALDKEDNRPDVIPTKEKATPKKKRKKRKEPTPDELARIERQKRYHDLKSNVGRIRQKYGKDVTSKNYKERKDEEDYKALKEKYGDVITRENFREKEKEFKIKEERQNRIAKLKEKYGDDVTSASLRERQKKALEEEKAHKKELRDRRKLYNQYLKLYNGDAEKAMELMGISENDEIFKNVKKPKKSTKGKKTNRAYTGGTFAGGTASAIVGDKRHSLGDSYEIAQAKMGVDKKGNVVPMLSVMNHEDSKNAVESGNVVPKMAEGGNVIRGYFDIENTTISLINRAREVVVEPLGKIVDNIKGFVKESVEKFKNSKFYKKMIETPIEKAKEFAKDKFDKFKTFTKSKFEKYRDKRATEFDELIQALAGLDSETIAKDEKRKAKTPVGRLFNTLILAGKKKINEVSKELTGTELFKSSKKKFEEFLFGSYKVENGTPMGRIGLIQRIGYKVARSITLPFAKWGLKQVDVIAKLLDKSIMPTLMKKGYIAKATFSFIKDEIKERIIGPTSPLGKVLIKFRNSVQNFFGQATKTMIGLTKTIGGLIKRLLFGSKDENGNRKSYGLIGGITDPIARGIRRRSDKFKEKLVSRGYLSQEKLDSFNKEDRTVVQDVVGRLTGKLSDKVEDAEKKVDLMATYDQASLKADADVMTKQNDYAKEQQKKYREEIDKLAQETKEKYRRQALANLKERGLEDPGNALGFIRGRKKDEFDHELSQELNRLIEKDEYYTQIRDKRKAEVNKDIELNKYREGLVVNGQLRGVARNKDGLAFNSKEANAFNQQQELIKQFDQNKISEEELISKINELTTELTKDETTKTVEELTSTVKDKFNLVIDLMKSRTGIGNGKFGNVERVVNENGETEYYNIRKDGKRGRKLSAEKGEERISKWTKDNSMVKKATAKIKEFVRKPDEESIETACGGGLFLPKMAKGGTTTEGDMSSIKEVKAADVKIKQKSKKLKSSNVNTALIEGTDNKAGESLQDQLAEKKEEEKLELEKRQTTALEGIFANLKGGAKSVKGLDLLGLLKAGLGILGAIANFFGLGKIVTKTVGTLAKGAFNAIKSVVSKPTKRVFAKLVNGKKYEYAYEAAERLADEKNLTGEERDQFITNRMAKVEFGGVKGLTNKLKTFAKAKANQTMSKLSRLLKGEEYQKAYKAAEYLADSKKLTGEERDQYIMKQMANVPIGGIHGKMISIKDKISNVRTGVMGKVLKKLWGNEETYEMAVKSAERIVDGRISRGEINPKDRDKYILELVQEQATKKSARKATEFISDKLTKAKNAVVTPIMKKLGLTSTKEQFEKYMMAIEREADERGLKGRARDNFIMQKSQEFTPITLASKITTKINDVKDKLKDKITEKINAMRLAHEAKMEALETQGVTKRELLKDKFEAVREKVKTVSSKATEKIKSGLEIAGTKAREVFKMAKEKAREVAANVFSGLRNKLGLIMQTISNGIGAAGNLASKIIPWGIPVALGILGAGGITIAALAKKFKKKAENVDPENPESGSVSAEEGNTAVSKAQKEVSKAQKKQEKEERKAQKKAEREAKRKERREKLQSAVEKVKSGLKAGLKKGFELTPAGMALKGIKTLRDKIKAKREEDKQKKLEEGTQLKDLLNKKPEEQNKEKNLFQKISDGYKNMMTLPIKLLIGSISGVFEKYKKAFETFKKIKEKVTGKVSEDKENAVEKVNETKSNIQKGVSNAAKFGSRVTSNAGEAINNLKKFASMFIVSKLNDSEMDSFYSGKNKYMDFPFLKPDIRAILATLTRMTQILIRGFDLQSEADKQAEQTTSLTKRKGFFASLGDAIFGNNKDTGTESSGQSGNGWGSGSVPYYSQTNSRWGNNRYANSNMSNQGCEPTAMAMIGSGLTGKKITPDSIANFNNRTGTSGKLGTHFNSVERASSAMGLNSSRKYNPTPADIYTNAQRGPMMLEGTSSNSDMYTKTGHYIVTDGTTSDGKVKVKDPRGNGYNRSYDARDLASKTNAAWKFGSGLGAVMQTDSGSSAGIEAPTPKSPTNLSPEDQSKKSAQSIINIAKNELGYQEKRSNESLNEPNSNVGDKNYTKYGAFMGANGQPWCASFVSWVFDQAYGGDRDKAKQALHGGYSAAVDGLWGNFKNSNSMSSTPEPGDVIIYKNGTSHTGIVESVNEANKTFTSIEGNTSGTPTGFERDGGVVAEKKDRPWNYSTVTGFGRPDYLNAKPVTDVAVNNPNIGAFSGTSDSSSSGGYSGTSGTSGSSSGSNNSNGSPTVTGTNFLADLISGFTQIVSKSFGILGNNSNDSSSTGSSTSNSNVSSYSPTSSSEGVVSDTGARMTAATLPASNGNERQEIFDYLTGKGLTSAGASGVMGCWEEESQNSPNTLEGNYKFKEDANTIMSDHALMNEYTQRVWKLHKVGAKGQKGYYGTDGNLYPGFGLAQWTGPRLEKLMRWSNEKGTDMRTLPAQLDFFYNHPDEYNSDKRAGLRDYLSKAEDPQDSATQFLDHFEMNNSTWHTTKTGAKQNEKRRANAQAIFDKYANSAQQKQDQQASIKPSDNVSKVDNGVAMYGSGIGTSDMQTDNGRSNPIATFSSTNNSPTGTKVSLADYFSDASQKIQNALNASDISTNEGIPYDRIIQLLEDISKNTDNTAKATDRLAKDGIEVNVNQPQGNGGVSEFDDKGNRVVRINGENRNDFNIFAQTGRYENANDTNYNSNNAVMQKVNMIASGM